MLWNLFSDTPLLKNIFFLSLPSRDLLSCRKWNKLLVLNEAFFHDFQKNAISKMIHVDGLCMKELFCLEIIY